MKYRTPNFLVVENLKLLSKMAESEQQSAYSAFVGRFAGKLTFFLRTIPNFGELLKPVEGIIHFTLLLYLQ